MNLPEPVKRWVEIFQGSMDVDRYLDLFTEDVEFRDGESGKVAHGTAELLDLVRPFTQLSDISATVLGYAVNGDRAFLEGELSARAPSGKPVVSRGVGVFTVSGERISRCAMYMFRQNVSL